MILRIYLRDHKAAGRERALAELLGQSLPVPQTYALGSKGGYTYAFVEYKSGIPLRDVLLGSQPFEYESLMQEVGEILTSVASHRFAEPGLLDASLAVTPYPGDGLLAFAVDCLSCLQLTDSRIASFLDENKGFLPDEGVCSLVHGDFDPANILVDQIQGQWRVTGILDWEFAFSGSPLWDLANMMRYAHQMPLTFTTAFIQGVRAGGLTLPEGWQQTIKVLNVTSLLDLLVRTNKKREPNRHQDICQLLNYFTE